MPLPLDKTWLGYKITIRLCDPNIPEAVDLELWITALQFIHLLLDQIMQLLVN
jgi:hypothetical protein